MPFSAQHTHPQHLPSVLSPVLRGIQQAPLTLPHKPLQAFMSLWCFHWCFILSEHLGNCSSTRLTQAAPLTVERQPDLPQHAEGLLMNTGDPRAAGQVPRQLYRDMPLGNTLCAPPGQKGIPAGQGLGKLTWDELQGQS